MYMYIVRLVLLMVAHIDILFYTTPTLTHILAHTHTLTHTRSHAGPIGKPPPPKVLDSRFRTESLSTFEDNKDATTKKGASAGSGKSDLLRSTSEENIIAAANAKVKGQSKGGIFSRKVVQTPKEPPPPKKPARSWLRGKDKGSPLMKRPMSAVVIDVSDCE